MDFVILIRFQTSMISFQIRLKAESFKLKAPGERKRFCQNQPFVNPAGAGAAHPAGRG
jgi:hypothetical protein